MIKLNDFVTKCLHSDKNNMCNILSILDFDEIWNKDVFINYLNEIIDKNTILKNYIEQKGDNLYWMEDSNLDFNIENFSSEFISGKKSEDAFYTMLYCVPNIKIQQYKNILKSFLQLKKQWIDIEHHIYDQENIYEISLLGIDAIYACGDTHYL